MSTDDTGRAQYRLTWTFANGRTLVRLVHFASPDAAMRAARADDFQRSVFRNANLHERTASACEYLDRFPVPTSVDVERIGS